MRIAIVALLLTGCVYEVHQADVAAWTGASVRDIQTHPIFSRFPRRVEHLGAGEDMWLVSACQAEANDVVCSRIGNAVICKGGESGSKCCHSQFIVKNGVVESYRPIGSCYTDCSTRPGGICKS